MLCCSLQLKILSTGCRVADLLTYFMDGAPAYPHPQACSHLDETLEGLAHRFQRTLFVRCLAPTRGQAASELKRSLGVTSLPGASVVCGMQAAVLTPGRGGHRLSGRGLPASELTYADEPHFLKECRQQLKANTSEHHRKSNTFCAFLR